MKLPNLKASLKIVLYSSLWIFPQKSFGFFIGVKGCSPPAESDIEYSRTGYNINTKRNIDLTNDRSNHQSDFLPLVRFFPIEYREFTFKTFRFAPSTFVVSYCENPIMNTRGPSNRRYIDTCIHSRTRVDIKVKK